jgi:hypothetical protein
MLFYLHTFFQEYNCSVKEGLGVLYKGSDKIQEEKKQNLLLDIHSLELLIYDGKLSSIIHSDLMSSKRWNYHILAWRIS